MKIIGDSRSYLDNDNNIEVVYKTNQVFMSDKRGLHDDQFVCSFFSDINFNIRTTRTVYNIIVNLLYKSHMRLQSNSSV